MITEYESNIYKLTICFSEYLFELSKLTASMWPKSMSCPSRKINNNLQTYFFFWYPSSVLSPLNLFLMLANSLLIRFISASLLLPKFKKITKLANSHKKALMACSTDSFWYQRWTRLGRASLPHEQQAYWVETKCLEFMIQQNKKQVVSTRISGMWCVTCSEFTSADRWHSLLAALPTGLHLSHKACKHCAK